MVTHTLTTSQTTHHCHPTQDHSNTSAHSKHTASHSHTHHTNLHKSHPTHSRRPRHMGQLPTPPWSHRPILSTINTSPLLLVVGGPGWGMLGGQGWPLGGGRQHLCHPATTRLAASEPHSGQNPHLPSATRLSTHTHLPLRDLGRTCGYRDTAIRESACCDTGGRGWVQTGPRPTSSPCVMRAKSPSLSEPPRPHL